MVDFYTSKNVKIDYIGTVRKQTILVPGSEAQPWAQAGPGTHLGGAAKGQDLQILV